MVDTLELDDAAVLWGLYTRLLGLVLCVSLLSLVPQVAGLASTYPIVALLDRVRVDTRATGAVRGGWCRRVGSFPTVFWAFPTLPPARVALVGAVAAGGFSLGVGLGLGALGNLALLFVAMAAYLSLGTVLGEYICFPWDCLVLEACWLSLVLSPPLLPMLGGGRSGGGSAGSGSESSFPLTLACAAAPSAPCVVAHRLLLFRLMFGMGKKKFGFLQWKWRSGANVDFLKWFTLWQPLPTPLAWAAYNVLPLAAWRAALHAMWLVECVLPLAYAPLLIQPVALIRCAGIVTIVFQLGIAALGNYGTFQVTTIALAITTLTPGSIATLPRGGVVEWAALALIATLGAAHLPFDSYTTNYWLFSDVVLKGDLSAMMYITPSSSSNGGGAAVTPLQPRTRALPAPLRALVVLCRTLAPWHVVHAYGVFGVAAPTERERGWRYALRFEVKADVNASSSKQPQDVGTAAAAAAGPPPPPGRRARFRAGLLRFKHYADADDAQLAWFAPHHPRIDHQQFYEAIGQRAGAFNLLNPYTYSSPQSARSTSCAKPWIVRLARRLLEGNPDARALFRGGVSAALLPGGEQLEAIRIVRVRMRFSTIAEKRATGKWFVEETKFAPHVLHVVTRSTPVGMFVLPAPSRLEIANAVWRRRAKVLEQPEEQRCLMG
mgnify:FL=1|tara:strand:- start:81 stop:2066 length:1986 start_codon:yes stop_codon:yes gene_type:complete